MKLLFANEEIELFEEVKTNLKDSINKWQQINKERKLESLNEYKETKSYVRNLWGNWRRIRKIEEQPGIGIIVSDDLNQNIPLGLIMTPILFDQQRETIKNKRQWKVRQKWL